MVATFSFNEISDYEIIEIQFFLQGTLGRDNFTFFRKPDNLKKRKMSCDAAETIQWEKGSKN